MHFIKQNWHTFEVFEDKTRPHMTVCIHLVFRFISLLVKKWCFVSRSDFFGTIAGYEANNITYPPKPVSQVLFPAQSNFTSLIASDCVEGWMCQHLSCIYSDKSFHLCSDSCYFWLLCTLKKCIELLWQLPTLSCSYQSWLQLSCIFNSVLLYGDLVVYSFDFDTFENIIWKCCLCKSTDVLYLLHFQTSLGLCF